MDQYSDRGLDILYKVDVVVYNKHIGAPIGKQYPSYRKTFL